MQSEPIQFGSVAASRAKRAAAGSSKSIRNALQTKSDQNAVSVRDAAFADFTRVDAGSSVSASPDQVASQNWTTLTQALISGIATQLETLDSQRRQLAQLLQCVDNDTTV